MATQTHKPLQMARAQITGNLLFMCPECYKVRSYRITPELYRFRCKACREVFYWSPRFLRAGGSGHRPKLNVIDRVFPEFAVEEWKEYQQLVEDHDSGDHPPDEESSDQ